MSPTFPRRWLVSRTLVPVAAAAALGLAATPAAADQVRHREWWLSSVHASTAWNSSRGRGVTVAVLDSGVDPAQRDLAGSVQPGPDYTQTGEAPGSAYWGGHGTGMAALIAGHGHGPGGANGTEGIAPAARILSIRVVPDRGDPAVSRQPVAARLPGAIASGISYAVAHGAKVIDLPLDPGTTGGGAAAAGGSAAERKAVQYALANGAVLVAPAGDGRAHRGAVNYPAAYPGVVAVGAVNRSFDLAPFSSRGNYVTLAAPGVEVGTARPDGSYPAVSSTAAASAIVAGAAALIRAGYPALQGSQVTQALVQSTMFHHSRRAGSGYGAVDAAGALHAAAAIAAASPGPAASPSARAAGQSARQPGFLGIALIAVGVAAVLVVAVLLIVRSGRRRHARRSPPPDLSPDSPLTGRILGPPLQASPLPAPPVPGRHRPRLAPVTGLPQRGDVKPSAQGPERPPWEDAPPPPGGPPREAAPKVADDPPWKKAPNRFGAFPPEGAPDHPQPTWPMAVNPAPGAPGPGAERPWPSVDEPPRPDGGPAWPSAGDAPQPPTSPNGQFAPAGTGPGTAGHGGDDYLPGASENPPGAGEGTGIPAHPDPAGNQAFSPVPAYGLSGICPAVADDPGLYEEEEQQFEEEDDRHL